VVVPLDFLRVPLIALIGWSFYGEALDALVLAGSGLIIAGVIWNLRTEARADAGSEGIPLIGKISNQPVRHRRRRRASLPILPVFYLVRAGGKAGLRAPTRTFALSKIPVGLFGVSKIPVGHSVTVVLFMGKLHM
jgi:hypothetical protein